MTSPSPTVRRRELGARLRALRLASGMTVEDVAGRMEVSPAKISRIETAARGVSVADVRFLCDLYRVSAEERDRILSLTRESKKRSWWQQYGLPESLATYIGLEESAVSILEYESGTVPALLQTREYARSMLEGSAPDMDDAVIDSLIDARLGRQSRFQGSAPAHLWAVVDESVLHRVVGTPEVMRDQLLAMASRLPHVTVQVIPFEAGAHPGINSSFIILELEGSVPDVVYVEGLLGQHYLQSAQDLRRYRRVFDQLRAIALSPRESQARIAEMADDYAA